MRSGNRRRRHGLTISVTLPTPTLIPVTVRNVIGLLRGSDPLLRAQYILLTAHYDHLGVTGSRCFPGSERRRQRHGVGDRNREGAGGAPGSSETQHRIYDLLRRRGGQSGLALLCPSPDPAAGARLWLT